MRTGRKLWEKSRSWLIPRRNWTTQRTALWKGGKGASAAPCLPGNINSLTRASLPPASDTKQRHRPPGTMRLNNMQSHTAAHYSRHVRGKLNTTRGCFLNNDRLYRCNLDCWQFTVIAGQQNSENYVFYFIKQTLTKRENITVWRNQARTFGPQL